MAKVRNDSRVTKEKFLKMLSRFLLLTEDAKREEKQRPSCPGTFDFVWCRAFMTRNSGVERTACHWCKKLCSNPSAGKYLKDACPCRSWGDFNMALERAEQVVMLHAAYGEVKMARKRKKEVDEEILERSRLLKQDSEAAFPLVTI